MQKPDAHGAVQYVESIAARCRSALGPEHRRYTNCQVLLSRALYNSNQNDKAIAMQQEVVSTLQKTVGDIHPQSQANTELLCFYLRDSGHFAEAEEASQKCLELLKKSGETNGPRMVEAHLLIGECKIERGRLQLHVAGCDPSEAHATLEEALTALKTAVDLARQQTGGNIVDIYTCLFHLATAHALLGQDDEAKHLFNRIIHETGDQTEKDAIRLIDRTYHAMRQLGLDEFSLVDKISHQEKRLQNMRAYADHHSANAIRDIMMDLAELYGIAGRVEDALDIVQQSLTWRLRNLGATHVDTIKTKFEASKLLEQLRNYADAERLQREILDHYDQIARDFQLSANFHEQRRSLVASIARLCFDQMKFREAEQMNKQALQHVNGPPQQKSAEWVTMSIHLATTWAVHGDGDQAEILSRQVLQACLEGNEAGLEEHVPRAFSNLIFVLQKRQKHDDAVSCALEAVGRDPRSSRARLDLMTARKSCGSFRHATLAGKAAMKLLQTQNDPSTTENGLYFTLFGILGSNFLDLGEYEQAKIAADQALLRFEKLDDRGKDSRLGKKLHVLRNLKKALERTGEGARVSQVSKEISSLEEQEPAEPLSQIRADQRRHLTERVFEASKLGLEEANAQLKREGILK